MSVKLILVFLLKFVVIGYSSPIVGGEDVGKVIQADGFTKVIGQDEFPFMAYVIIVESDTVNHKKEIDNMYNCGGVIITANAVLTAAHCLVDSVSIPEVYVQVGIVHLDYEDGTQFNKVVKHVIHNKYIYECPINKEQDGLCLNDIAILWVEKNFIFNQFVKKAILIDSTFKNPNGDGWIIGWGTNENGQKMRMLQKAYMNILPHDECTVVNKEVLITDEMICLISKNKNAGSCNGDSGGPFVVNGVVYGISAFHATITLENNRKTCDTTSPVVYTNVGSYYKWIIKELLLGPSPVSRQYSGSCLQNREEKALKH